MFIPKLTDKNYNLQCFLKLPEKDFAIPLLKKSWNSIMVIFAFDNYSAEPKEKNSRSAV